MSSLYVLYNNALYTVAILSISNFLESVDWRVGKREGDRVGGSGRGCQSVLILLADSRYFAIKS